MMRSLGLILLILSARAFAGEGNADSRELCRAAVSGTYLRYMNDLDLLKSHLVASSERSFSLKARKTVSTKELKALEARNEAAKVPASELDEELLGLRHAIETTTDSIQENDVQTATLKGEIAAKEKEFLAFQNQIRPVFEVTKASGVAQGAYPIQLKYRHACREYFQLCPLPKAQVETLLKVAKDLEDPTPCERYAQIR